MILTRTFLTVLAALSFLCSCTAWAANTTIGVHTAAPGVLAVIVESDFLLQASTAPFTLTSSQWKVDGVEADTLNRYTVPYDSPRKADLDPTDHEVRVRHRIYMDMGFTFMQDEVYSVTTPHGTIHLTY